MWFVSLLAMWLAEKTILSNGFPYEDEIEELFIVVV